jgi:large subunit ribosomal protein L21
MYAIIQDGGRQYKVEEGQELNLDFRDVSAGDQITLDNVLALGGDSGLRFAADELKGASVTAKVVGVRQGPKLHVQHFRRRKGYRKRTGHRQLYTRVKISKINAG